MSRKSKTPSKKRKKVLNDSDSDKEKLEAAQKTLNDVLMPIGAKLYQSQSSDASANAGSSDENNDETVEGEVIDK